MNIAANTTASYLYVWERSSLINSYSFYADSISSAKRSFDPKHSEHYWILETKDDISDIPDFMFKE